MITAVAHHLREATKRAVDAFVAATSAHTPEFTELVNSCRYWAGFACVATTFCVFPYWLSVHPFLPLWRRLGRGPTIVAHAGLSSALVSRMASYATREAIMHAFGGDLGFPTRYALYAALVLAAASTWLKLRWMREMDIATASGWKGELERGGKGGELLTSGIYSIVRHPRYAQIMVRLLPPLPPLLLSLFRKNRRLERTFASVYPL